MLRRLIAQLCPGFALPGKDTRTVENDIYHGNRIVTASVLKYTLQSCRVEERTFFFRLSSLITMNPICTHIQRMAFSLSSLKVCFPNVCGLSS